MGTTVTTWTIGELASLAGISVRTLHYYHQIGLLVPARSGDNGYRTYDPEDLVRLQQILFFRELELPLDQIGQMLDRPELDRGAIWRDHRRLLAARRNQLSRLIDRLDRELAHEGADNMATDADRISPQWTNDELDGFRAEARQRWGSTDAWKQSQERTANMTEADMKRAVAEHDGVMRRMAAVMPKGAASPEVQALVAEHRQGLARYMDIPDEMYRCFADMYVDDDRFASTYRRFDPAMPEFLWDAIYASLGLSPDQG